MYCVQQSSHEDVTVESVVVVAPNDCKSVEVLYQPTSIANIAAELVAVSSQAGTFMLVSVYSISFLTVDKYNVNLHTNCCTLYT